jgi:hypothetical protein
MTIDELIDRALTLIECNIALRKKELELRYAATIKEEAKPETVSAPEPEEAPVEEAPVEEAQPTEQNPSYDELKAKLIDLGFEIKPRTKYNTLVKMMADFEAGKLAPATVAEETTVEEAMAAAEVTVPEPVVEPVVEAAAEPALPQSMTREQLREEVSKIYTPGDLSDRDNLAAALKFAGVERAVELKENGDCEKVLAKYKELKGVA